MNNSAQLLNAVSDLASKLGEIDADIADLKTELRSFAGECEDGETPVALPADWTPDKARRDLDAKLLERHKLAPKLAEAEAAYESARNAELQKAFGEVQKQYKQTVITMLKASLALANAVKDCETLRERGRDITGGTIGSLPHIGPSFEHWTLTDRTSWIAHWVAESIRAGYVSGNEPWLDGVVF